MFLSCVLVGTIAMAVVHGRADARTRAAYVEALEGEPGIVVNSAEWRRGHGRFVGLRDPLSHSPENALARHGLGPTDLQFAPFVSLDPRIEQRRAERVLDVPPGVTAKIDAGTLRLAGIAPRAWIERARLLGRSLPGAESYDGSALRSQESMDGLRDTAAELEALTISFTANQSHLSPARRALVGRVAANMFEAMRFASEAHVGACLEVTGHADPPGERGSNQALSDARAARVAEELVARGVPPQSLAARGAGVWDVGPPRGRSVTFHLAGREASGGAGCAGAR
jgi:outer membrane protein OmpA-like peptidoglycan-associated protein